MKFLALIVLFYFFPALSQTCPSGTVSYYDFNDTGNLGNDVQGTNNGTSSGTVSLIAGIHNDALSLAGSGFLDIAEDTSLDFSSQFSISLWVSENSLKTKKVIVGKYGQNGREWALRKGIFSGEKKKITLSFGDAAGGFLGDFTTDADVIASANTWYHIVATYDAGTVNFYIDGAPVSGAVTRGTIPTSLNQGGSNLRIGNAGPGINHYYDGKIDDVLILNRVITAAEANDLYRRVSLYGVSSCTPVTISCGDGIVDGAEKCDDGNTVSGDGCSSTCEIESTIDGGLCEANLVAYWPFDNPAFLQLDEISGELATPVSVSGVSGKRQVSASFTGGSRSVIEVSERTDLDFSDQWSSVFWFNESQITNGTVLVGKYGQNLREWAIRKGLNAADNKKIMISFGDQNGDFIGDWISAEDIVGTAGTWYQLAVTFKDGTVKIYINGQPVAGEIFRGTIPTTMNTGGAALTIGNSHSSLSKQFIGQIDELTLYSRELSAADVLSLYNKTEHYGLNQCETAVVSCGNSVQDPGEQCDDGNSAAGDGCSASCEFERSFDPASCDPSILSYWTFNNPIFRNFDEIANKNSTMNNLSIASALDGDGIQTSTSSSFLNVAEDTEFDLVDDFTVVASFNEDTAGERKIIVGKWAQNKREWALRKGLNNPKRLMVSFGDANGDFAGDWMSAYDVFSGMGEWYNIAFTFEAGVVRLFVNGEEVPGFISRGFIPTQMNVSGTNLRIGAAHTNLGHQFSGIIDDVAIYTDVLTAARIRDLSNNYLHYNSHQCQTVAAQCGNSLIENAEQCDDGNVLSGDGCSSSCQIERHVDVNSCPSDLKAYFTFNNSQFPGTNENSAFQGQVSDPSTISGSGRFGGGASFNNSHFDFYDSPELDIETELTAMLWFKESTFQDSKVIVGKYGQNGREWAIRKGFTAANKKKLMVSFGDASGGFSGDWMSSNEILSETDRWYHFAFTFNAGVVKFYLDGVEVPGEIYRDVIPAVINTTGSALRVASGSDGISHQFNGSVDELAIFDRALTASEVGYYAGSDKFCQGAYPPIVGDDQAFSGDEDSELLFSLNPASDIDSTALTYHLVSISTGTLTGCLDGTSSLSCSYQPELNFNGEVEIIYNVSDGTLNSQDTAKVTLTINPVNDLPVAHLTLPPSQIEQGQSANYSVSASDVDGTISSISWDFGDGSPVKTGASVAHTYTQFGSFTVQVDITDDQGGLTSLSETVVANSLPLVDFNFPSSNIVNTSVDFTAVASDLDGQIVQYRWNFGDGTSFVETAPNTTHVFSTTGDFNVTLTAVDDLGSQSSIVKTVSVSLANQPPVSGFNFNPPTAITGAAVDFTSTSFDPDGSIATYVWDFGDGSIVSTTTPNATYTYNTSGNYVVSLSVIDDGGLTAISSKPITVALQNIAPVADFELVGTKFIAGENVNFLSTSSDADGNIVNHRWVFGDGNEVASGQSTHFHAYAAAGTYNVILEVTDNLGETGTVTKAVVVVEPNILPTADFVFSPIPAFNGSQIQMVGSASDPDGQVVLYRWDFGDGTQLESNVAAVSHLYSGTGEFPVTLTVVDDRGGETTVRKGLEVLDVSTPESVSITTLSSDFFVNHPLSLFANVSNVDDVVTYSWDLGDGTVAATTDSYIDHIYQSEGTFTATLTVEYADGDFYSDTFELEVGPEQILVYPQSVESDQLFIQRASINRLPYVLPVRNQTYIFNVFRNTKSLGSVYQVWSLSNNDTFTASSENPAIATVNIWTQCYNLGNATSCLVHFGIDAVSPGQTNVIVRSLQAGNIVAEASIPIIVPSLPDKDIGIANLPRVVGKPIFGLKVSYNNPSAFAEISHDGLFGKRVTSSGDNDIANVFSLFEPGQTDFSLSAAEFSSVGQVVSSVTKTFPVNTYFGNGGSFEIDGDRLLQYFPADRTQFSFTKDFSINFWVRSGTNLYESGGNILHFSAGDYLLTLRDEGKMEKLRLSLLGTGARKTLLASGLETHEFINVGISHNSGELSMYIDGVLIGRTTIPAAGSGNFIEQLRLGGTSGLEGSYVVDDFNLWNRALSDSEFENIVSMSHLPPSGHIESYSFDSSSQVQGNDLGGGGMVTRGNKRVIEATDASLTYSFESLFAGTVSAGQSRFNFLNKWNQDSLDFEFDFENSEDVKISQFSKSYTDLNIFQPGWFLASDPIVLRGVDGTSTTFRIELPFDSSLFNQSTDLSVFRLNFDRDANENDGDSHDLDLDELTPIRVDFAKGRVEFTGSKPGIYFVGKSITEHLTYTNSEISTRFSWNSEHRVIRYLKSTAVFPLNLILTAMPSPGQQWISGACSNNFSVASPQSLANIPVFAFSGPALFFCDLVYGLRYGSGFLGGKHVNLRIGKRDRLRAEAVSD